MASFTKTYHHAPYPSISPTLPSLSAAGKFVVITGGATGIGRAIALAFAQAGPKTLAILGRRPDRLATTAAELAQEASANKHTVQVLFEPADISKRASLDNAVASIVKQAGGAKIDVLIHSAGVSQDVGVVSAYDVEQFREGLEINVVGALNVVGAFAPALAARPQVFNISSGMAHLSNNAPWVEHWSYASGKAAVTKMFDYLQEQEKDWHVVQVQPGVVATELNHRFGQVGQDTPELCGHFCVWLASPEAAFLKGKFVWANWDADQLKARAEEIQSSSLLRIQLNGLDM